MLRAAGCHATFEPESLYVSREFADTIFVTIKAAIDTSIT